MNIAEFFLKIGLKGADETAKGVGKVTQGIGDAVSKSLAFKAALAGMAYGLQRVMSKSSEAGASINQFENSTGLSGKLLQQWQYAARQFNVESEEMTGSIRSVQDAMTNMLLGKGAPEGFGMVANMVDIDPERVRDTYYVLEKLQEFAKKVPADVSKSMLKSFGLSEGIIAAMRQNAFRPDVFSQAPIYSDKEVKQLRKVNVEWDNLYDRVGKAFGRINALHGEGLVKDIGGVVDKVLLLTEVLIKLADKLKIFELVGKSIEGWSLIFGGAADFIDEKTGEKVYMNQEGETGASAYYRDAGLNLFNMAKSIFTDDYEIRTGEFVKPSIPPALKAPDMTTVDKSSTSVRGDESTDNSTRSATTTINQTFTLKENASPKEIGDSVKKATRDAFRQNAAQRQVN